jgi:hypothetical protein
MCAVWVVVVRGPVCNSLRELFKMANEGFRKIERKGSVVDTR